jgi:hypothetical protein
LLAVDGTRIKAVNNKDRNFTRASLTQFIKAADAKLEDYLQRLDKSDATESGKDGSRVKNLAEKIAAIRERRERHKDMLAELDQTGESQISLTDPDSRAMAAHTHVAVGYFDRRFGTRLTKLANYLHSISSSSAARVPSTTGSKSSTGLRRKVRWSCRRRTSRLGRCVTVLCW